MRTARWPVFRFTRPSQRCFRQRLGRRLALALALAMVATSVPVPATPTAAQERYSPPEVMAIALFRLVSFVRWPEGSFPSPEAHLNLCLVTEDDVFDALKFYEGMQASGRPVHIERLSKIGDAESCHLVFIAEGLDAESPEQIRKLSAKGCLTVSDTPRFAHQGGIIGMRFQQRRLHFEINLETAKRAGIVLSSQLLALADIVETP